MTIIISSNAQQKHFNKKYIKIGSAPDSDFCMDIGTEFQLTLQYSEVRKAYTLTNTLANNCFLVKNSPLPLRCLIRNGVRIDVLNSNISITIKIIDVLNYVQMIRFERLCLIFNSHRDSVEKVKYFFKFFLGKMYIYLSQILHYKLNVSKNV